VNRFVHDRDSSFFAELNWTTKERNLFVFD